jgi:hypothetical protein
MELSMNEKTLFESLRQYRVPEHLHGAIVRYVLRGIPPGGFLSAVICNDLKESLGRADEINTAAIFNIVSWFYNCAPSECWKSQPHMNAWIKSRQSGDEARDEINESFGRQR